MVTRRVSRKIAKGRRGRPGTRDYDAIYSARPWAYSDKPDEELIRALHGRPRGRALDVAGGQGRHGLALATLGFDVTLIDSSATGLHQAASAAAAQDVHLNLIDTDVASFRDGAGFEVIVAALFFHIPARRRALEIATKLGSWLVPSGLFYFSMPGFDRERRRLAEDILEASGCQGEIAKRLVTKAERPRLPVPRRNETRVVATKPV